ncbi:hypothetical protein LTR86_004438 [Recurvomyces mirabilis]|nr:hypothetical protein LTR86_004438 [Recurvomyces mirabilis]
MAPGGRFGMTAKRSVHKGPPEIDINPVSTDSSSSDQTKEKSIIHDEGFNDEDLASVVQSVEDPQTGFAPDVDVPKGDAYSPSPESHHSSRFDLAVVNSPPTADAAHHPQQATSKTAPHDISSWKRLVAFTRFIQNPDAVLNSRSEQMIRMIGKIGRQKWAQIDIHYGAKVGQVHGLLQAHLELKTAVDAHYLIKWKSGDRSTICDRVMGVLRKLGRRGKLCAKGHALSVTLQDRTLEVFMALPSPITEGVVKLTDGSFRIEKYRVDY